ncbi:MAG: glycosyltransferase family 4 protein [Deltaproteobacteria bacterium]|nr:glycosyltransferase family 4 protein [Deltaproteobacteria bacterium]
MSPHATVGYVLKAFPRASETFITSEIYRLEQAGLSLTLFVTKPVEEHDRSPRHPVVDQIHAPIDCLPVTTSLSTSSLSRWVATNSSLFASGLFTIMRRQPLGFARAVTATLMQIVRTSRTVWSFDKKSYVKDFFQAVALAERLHQSPEVRHLHAHYAHGATTVAWLAAMMTGLSFSFTGHAKDIYAESLNPAGLLRRKLAAARFVVTCTEVNQRHLQQFAHTTPVHRVYHGLNADLTHLLAQARQRTAPQDTLRLLSVGRLVPKKGFDIVVEACGILQSRDVPFEAFLVGPDGGQSSILQQRIVELGLSQSVHIVGPLSQAELHEEYARATAFCLPCRVLGNGDRDGIPNVLVEAMACGVPVITTGISGILELVTDERTGLLIPPNNPEALVEAILRLHHDPALASRLSTEAQATVHTRFDGEQLAHQLVTLFQQVLV